VKRKSLHETITFSRTLKKIDDSATIKSSGFREQVDKTSLSAASTGSSIKAWRKLLEATLLDPIVWLSSFHKEPEFSLPRPARSDAFSLDFPVLGQTLVDNRTRESMGRQPMNFLI